MTKDANIILPTGDVDTDLNFIVTNRHQNNKLRAYVPESKFNRCGLSVIVK